MSKSGIMKSAGMGLFNAYRSVALEISALLFMTSVLMTYLISQDFIMMRVCRVGLNQSEGICREIIKNTGNYTEEEIQIQKEMTHIRRIRSLLDYTIPVLFVIFQGSWSDIYGRKLPLLLPCVGFFLQAMVFNVSHYLPNLDAMTIVIISAIVKSVYGADVTFRMAALSHISDISDKSGRTVRTGLITGAFTIGVPTGFAIGGAMMKASVDLHISFLISAGICAISFATIAIFVDNKVISSENSDLGKVEKKYFTWGNMKSVLKSLVLNFDGVGMSERIQIFVLIFAIICVNAPIQGEFGVMYLYLRKRLMWDASDYGLFSTYVFVVGVTGTFLSMGILCTLMKLSDPVIGFIAGLSQFGGCFMYAFAYNNLMIYLAPSIDMLNGTMAVVAKSMLSKLCPPEDFGKMFSFLAVIELLVPLVFDPTYSTLYEHTLDTFPGAVFLLSAVLTVPPQLTYLFYIYWNSRNADQFNFNCDTIDSKSPSTTPSSTEGKEEVMKKKSDRKFQSNCNCIAFPQNSPVALKSAMSTTTVDTVIF